MTGAPDTRRLLTIVVTSYNHARYLPDLLESVAMASPATRAAITLLVIDDGSSDNSMTVARSFSFPDDLNIGFVEKPNAGLIDSLRRGLAICRTPFICFIASDDLYNPAALDELVARLTMPIGPDLCWVCQARYRGGRGDAPVYNDATRRLLELPPRARLRAISIEYPKPLLLQSTVFSAAVLRRADAWAHDVRLDDWPTFVQVAAAAVNAPVDIRFVPEIELCLYRQHGSGVHHDSSKLFDMCMEVATTVISPEYRHEAVSRVRGDFALIFVHQRQLARAARHYLRSMQARPSLDALLRPWGRMARAAGRRVMARVTGRT